MEKRRFLHFLWINFSLEIHFPINNANTRSTANVKLTYVYIHLLDDVYFIYAYVSEDASIVGGGWCSTCYRSPRIPTVQQSRLTAVPHAWRSSVQVPKKYIPSQWILENLKQMSIETMQSDQCFQDCQYFRDQLTLQAARAVADFAKRCTQCDKKKCDQRFYELETFLSQAAALPASPSI